MTEQDTINQPSIPGESPYAALPPHGYDEPPLVETALAWVEENQSTAMLTAFAIGVFLGVLMRR